MRFLAVLLLLVATALLASGDVDARKDHLEGETTTRALRYVDTEERALAVPPPSMAVFTKWVKSLGSKITDNVQARYWLLRKQSADDIFKKLKLDGDLDTLLSNPKLKTLSTYIDLLNKKNPDKWVSMAGTIAKTYGDLALANKLEYALNNRSQRRMAARLAFELRDDWYIAGKTAEDVFTMLKLDKAGDNLLQTPQLNSWFNYVMTMEKDAKSVMISVLTSRYGDDGLVKILFNSKPRNRRMRWVRLQLETAMGNEWVDQLRDPVRRKEPGKGNDDDSNIYEILRRRIAGQDVGGCQKRAEHGESGEAVPSRAV